MKPFFENNPNTPIMLAEVAAHQIRPETDMPDINAVILAFAYDQETDPGNTDLVHQWAREFPAYADELLAVSFARTAMGWRIDDDEFDDSPVDEEIAQMGRDIVAATRQQIDSLQHSVQQIDSIHQVDSVSNPLFPLGQLDATQGALTALAEAGILPQELIVRHQQGDWGDLDAHDRRMNEDGLSHGERLLSAYNLPNGCRIWIITEADRSYTTLMRPDEY